MASTASRLQTYPSKPRVFIISDISNEPDDAESLCRYLLYSNQFDTEGLVACTSTWMRTKVCPQDMIKIINAYAGAVDNLNKHTHPNFPYPSAEHVRSLVRSGPPVYGMTAVGDDIPISEGAKLLVSRIEAALDRPLWVLCWGGANVLAQALLSIRNTRPAAEAAALRARVRVYAISDQDDSAGWIRAQFPDVFYIASVHAWNQYGMAAWTGISGDRYYGFDSGGPDFDKVTKEWIREHIQIGPLGGAYPDYMFIPEGDTPTFLYLIQNGLGVPEHPEYGSWGGRYGLVDGAQRASGHYADEADVVVGKDGRRHTSSQATIWRWRDAFQNDFAARVRWTMAPDFSGANHAPVVYIGDDPGPAPVLLEAEAGTTLTVDASRTYDPDEGDDGLAFKWWHYREPSATQWATHFEVEPLGIRRVDGEGRVVEVTLPPAEKCCVQLISREPMARGQLLHLILEVTDSGTPALTTYRRIMIQTTNKELKGGGGGGAEAVGDAIKAMVESQS
ncbi:hypothetical protein GGTG_03541 [Gaeumannomyces tritici R3-111a-1]|uniref:Cellulose-binding protein n=1 Tax=Gaeumannomyces tritici (strain R3-111a-1) TaxID=644352 RepID=J3NQI4_GAET3|nr:hypothetical protein GGTG_03541 [Gaeumannomyces tritici R3-111a-1]EJT78440.1 hypothetical protein GGTG_03541 [Gaeumannomyces tritici R3-111a-1]